VPAPGCSAALGLDLERVSGRNLLG
jgi:hypothetical protein